MTPQQKRILFPLRAPRTLSLCWWPVTVVTAAVDVPWVTELLVGKYGLWTMGMT